MVTRLHIDPESYPTGGAGQPEDAGNHADPLPELIPPVGESQPKETYHVLIWPSPWAVEWIGERPQNAVVRRYPDSGPNVASIVVQAYPRNLAGTRFGHTWKVRLDPDGRQRNFLPVSGNPVEIEYNTTSGFSSAESADVDY